MATSTTVLPSEAPQRLYNPPEPSTPFELALVRLGCRSKAERSAISRAFWKWYKVQRKNAAPDTALNAWREPLSTTMLRTDEWKAQDLAKDQENIYRKLVEFVGETFATLQFRFYAKPHHIKSLEHEKDQADIRGIREVVSEYLPHSFDKLGAMADPRYNYRLKVMHFGIVDAALLAKIVAALPAGVSVVRYVHAASEFHDEFLRLLNPDLPKRDSDRAAFEVLMAKLVQIQLHGFSREERKRFAYSPDYTYANHSQSDGLSAPEPCDDCKKVHSIRIPRSPKTGEYATHVSVTVDATTKAEDLLPDEWIELPSPVLIE